MNKEKGKRNRLIVGKDWGEGKSETDLHVSIYLIFSVKILTREAAKYLFTSLAKEGNSPAQETLLI